MGGCSRPRRQHGLTLLELLVTLVIASAAMTVLAQAVWQVYRIEAALADERMRGQTLLLRTEWIRHALNGLQAGDNAGRGRLRGNERELSGTTSSPIGNEAGGYGELVLRLRFDIAAGSTVLEHVRRDAPLRETAQVLLRWPGDQGRFVYLRRDGSQERQWPPALGVQERLPVAIVVETGLSGRATLVAAPPAVDRIQPSRREIEQL